MVGQLELIPMTRQEGRIQNGGSRGDAGFGKRRRRFKVFR